MSSLPPPPDLPPRSPTFTPGGIGRRITARILDLLLIGIIDISLLRPRFTQGIRIPDVPLTELAALPASYTVLSAVLALGYFALFESKYGATPGKRVMNLQVYAPDGNPPSLPNAVRRSLFAVAGVVAAVPFVGQALALPLNLFAVITIIITIQRSLTHQGWHDRFGGNTLVTYRR